MGMEEMMMAKVFEYEGKIAAIEKTLEYMKQVNEANAGGIKTMEQMLNDLKVEMVKGEKGTTINVSADTNIDNIERDANITQG